MFDINDDLDCVIRLLRCREISRYSKKNDSFKYLNKKLQNNSGSLLAACHSGVFAKNPGWLHPWNIQEVDHLYALELKYLNDIFLKVISTI